MLVQKTVWRSCGASSAGAFTRCYILELVAWLVTLLTRPLLLCWLCNTTFFLLSIRCYAVSIESNQEDWISFSGITDHLQYSRRSHSVGNYFSLLTISSANSDLRFLPTLYSQIYCGFTTTKWLKVDNIYNLLRKLTLIKVKGGISTLIHHVINSLIFIVFTPNSFFFCISFHSTPRIELQSVILGLCLFTYETLTVLLVLDCTSFQVLRTCFHCTGVS